MRAVPLAPAALGTQSTARGSPRRWQPVRRNEPAKTRTRGTEQGLRGRQADYFQPSFGFGQLFEREAEVLEKAETQAAERIVRAAAEKPNNDPLATGILKKSAEKSKSGKTKVAGEECERR